MYVAAIAAHHNAVDGKSVGKHDLVIRFLRGARRLNPPRPHLVPTWDLPSVLSALRGGPFEPLQSVELKFLSLKTVLLAALATVKRVGDLQAFSVDDSCLEFGPGNSHVVLRPRPGYVPKVPTTPFRDQVVNLQALPREEADPAMSRPRLAHLRGPHAELQDLRSALCLLWRTAEGEGCFQKKTRPLDSGGYSLGLSGPVLTVPLLFWLSTEAVAFSPRPHPYLPCFAPLFASVRFYPLAWSSGSDQRRISGCGIRLV